MTISIAFLYCGRMSGALYECVVLLIAIRVSKNPRVNISRPVMAANMNTNKLKRLLTVAIVEIYVPQEESSPNES